MMLVGPTMPPVTGERLCRQMLVEELPAALGTPVAAFGNNDWRYIGIGRRLREPVWLLPGAGVAGTLRDLAAMALVRPPLLFLHFHNASFSRLLRLRWLHGLLSRRVIFVALTRKQVQAAKARGIEAIQLRNTVRAVSTERPAAGLRRRRLIWLGAISEEKGFDVAYAAFLSLAERTQGEQWVFDVYGNADASLRSRHPAATFRGFANEAQKPAIWSEGGIFVLPSRYRHETQPLAILEAMAAGIPTVATDVGGIAEMLEPVAKLGAPGILLPAGVSAEKAGRAIEDAYARHEELSRAASAGYAERFSADVFRNGLQAALELGIRPGTSAGGKS